MERKTNGHQAIRIASSLELSSPVTGADISQCPTPGASPFTDWSSEISLGTCPWASYIY